MNLKRLFNGASRLLGALLWISVAASIAVTTPAHAEAQADAPADKMRPGSEPVETVARFQAALAEAAARSGCTARATHLSTAVAGLFDMPGIARKVLRRHWSDLDLASQQRFVRHLQQSTVLGYAAHFTAREPRFEAPQLQRRQGERAQVQSQLLRSDKEPVRFSYLLEARDDSWRIVNVLVDGVSELSLRSAQYGGLMEREGFDALLDRMNRQIQETRAACE